MSASSGESVPGDAQLAAELAEEAGRLLLEVRARERGRTEGRELGRVGDAEANDLIVGALRRRRPNDAILSEESADDLSRLDASRVWIIDPLDGSREYGVDGRDDWAVHIALWESTRDVTGESTRDVAGESAGGVTAAAVAQPALGVVYSTVSVAVPPRRTERPALVVSGSRPPYYIEALAAEVGGDVVHMGSAGAKAMAVVRGDVDAYVHSGGQWEWDSAAPVGVAFAAGLHCSRIDGSPLLYNQRRPYLPDLLICRPELTDVLLSGIARHATREADSGRVAMAREYTRALVTHDATTLRLAESCRHVRNGEIVADTGRSIREELEQGARHRSVSGVRDASFEESSGGVLARYQLDFDSGTTVAVSEHFEIPAGEITAITTLVAPARESS